MGITLDQLNRIHTVYTHANCPDGTASAIMVRDALPKVEIIFVQHNTDQHKTLEASDGALFIDFAPHESRVEDFVKAGAFVLDHHKTARPIVEAFGDHAVFGDEVTEPGVCGAVLAYRHVWKPIMERYPLRGLSFWGALRGKLLGAAKKTLTNAESFATLAGVRDTWQKNDPRWKQACAQGEMLRFYPAEDWIGQGLAYSMFDASRDSWWADRMALGRLILKKHEEGVKKAIQKAFRFTTSQGTRVVILSDNKTPSDAAEALGDKADLVMGFFFEVRGEEGTMVNVSTRSRGTFNCAALCKSLGGGGHTNAAGFSLPVEVDTCLNPYALLRDVVNTWERVPETDRFDRPQLV